MKNLKLGFIALCGLVLSLSSCSKDDDNTSSPNNTFLLNGTNYLTDKAFSQSESKNGVEYTELSITNLPLQITSAVNNINSVSFLFNLADLPVNKTLTYADEDNANFNKNNNFSFSLASAGTTVTPEGTSGETVSSGGSTYSSSDLYNATGSTVSITKNGDNYTIVYNLKFTKDNKTTIINGQYSGTITFLIPTPNNSFVVGNINYLANKCYVKEYNPDPETEMYFATKPLSKTGSVTGLNVAYFDFNLKTLPPSGTYTYKNKTTAGFDATKNFDDVVVAYNTTYTYETPNFAGGTVFDAINYDATGSTVTISKSSDNYTVVYTLKFTKDNKTTTINGQYTGTITKQ